MHDNYRKFLAESDTDRRDVFNAAAQNLQVPPEYIEKDFWVCLTLDVLFNSEGMQSHKLLFKGGTALSKGHGLIKRFSEDIDIVVFRDDLGFRSESDPTNRALELGTNARNKLFEQLRSSCQAFMLGDLSEVLASATAGLGCAIFPDDEDKDNQTVLVQYKSLFKFNTYVKPIVKIEGGARSGLTPHNILSIKPYIADVVSVFDFTIFGIRTIDAERTFWEKILILHGLHCGYRDDKKLPSEANRLSRHYYDVAMLSQSKVSTQAINNIDLLNEVREHNLVAFNQKWKKFNEAVPGRIMIIPQDELAVVLANDYKAMSGMIMGDEPKFDSILDEIRRLYDRINPSH
jgi:hypothetical protein